MRIVVHARVVTSHSYPNGHAQGRGVLPQRALYTYRFTTPALRVPNGGDSQFMMKRCGALTIPTLPAPEVVVPPRGLLALIPQVVRVPGSVR